MLDSEVLLPVVGQALVEGAVLLSSDVLRVAGPDGLRLVKLLVLNGRLLDLLGLFLLLLFLLFDFLNLGLVLGVLLGFLLVILNILWGNDQQLQMSPHITNAYLLDLLGHSKLDRI